VRPEYSRFSDEWTDFKTYREVIEEVRKLGGTDLFVTSNLTLTISGSPYARQKVEDKGVAVYFVRKGKQLVFACDKYLTVAHNLHAISKTLDAIRGIERWGTSAMVDAAFSGYLALPEQSHGNEWWRTLGFQSQPGEARLRNRYLALVKSAHPDTGGSTEEFQVITDAYNTGMRALGAG
jgi:hypothetical protein